MGISSPDPPSCCAGNSPGQFGTPGTRLYIPVVIEVRTKKQSGVTVDVGHTVVNAGVDLGE